MLPYVTLADVYDCHDSPVHLSVMFTLILCEVHVEVVKMSVLLFPKVSVFGTQTKSLTTKIHEMCN